MPTIAWRSYHGGKHAIYTPERVRCMPARALRTRGFHDGRQEAGLLQDVECLAQGAHTSALTHGRLPLSLRISKASNSDRICNQALCCMTENACALRIATGAGQLRSLSDLFGFSPLAKRVSWCKAFCDFDPKPHVRNPHIDLTAARAATPNSCARKGIPPCMRAGQYRGWLPLGYMSYSQAAATKEFRRAVGTTNSARRIWPSCAQHGVQARDCTANGHMRGQAT